MDVTGEPSEYTVVLRSTAGARVRPGLYADFKDFPDGYGRSVHVRVSTRWEESGVGHPLPRELWFAVRIFSDDLDSAVLGAPGAASSIALLISFCANAVVEPPGLHIAFNSSAGLARREFIEVFRRDETGHPHTGRWVDLDALFEFGIAAFRSRHGARLFRALAQYQVALRYWNTGSQVLALAHLYICCEVLTKAIQRFHQDRLGLSEEAHARLLGVDTSLKNWKFLAEAFTRREYIFEGDTLIYKAARKASDEFEHGMADLLGVRQTAEAVSRELFDLVRSSILTLLPDSDSTTQDHLMLKGPVDISPVYKQITGFIVSDGPSDPSQLGLESELFPTLKWESRIKSVQFESDELHYDPEETITIQFAPGLKFEGRDLAVYGGLNPARETTGVERPSGWQKDWTVAQSSDLGLTVTQPETDLSVAAMALIDAAAAEGPQPFPRMHAFSMFGQGVAYFQSVITLVQASQPTEALFTLRALAAIAGRFEQFYESKDKGATLVLRVALDAAADRAGATGGDVLAAQEDLMRLAKIHQLRVPDHLPTVKETSVWRSLRFETQLARMAETPSGLPLCISNEETPLTTWDFIPT